MRVLCFGKIDLPELNRNCSPAELASASTDSTPDSFSLAAPAPGHVDGSEKTTASPFASSLIPAMARPRSACPSTPSAMTFVQHLVRPPFAHLWKRKAVLHEESLFVEPPDIPVFTTFVPTLRIRSARAGNPQNFAPRSQACHFMQASFRPVSVRGFQRRYRRHFPR